MASYDIYGDPSANYAVTSNSNPQNIVSYTAPAPPTPAPIFVNTSVTKQPTPTPGPTPAPVVNTSVNSGGGGGSAISDIMSRGFNTPAPAPIPVVNTSVSGGNYNQGGGSSAISNIMSQGFNTPPPAPIPVVNTSVTKQPETQLQPQQNEMQKQLDTLRTQTESQIKLLQQQKADTEKQLNDYVKSSNDAVTNLLNGVREYNDQYKTQLSQIMEQMMKPFNYDPNADSDLQSAYKYADAKIQADLVRRGMDDSSVSASSRIELMRELMPKYQNLALEKYNANISRLIQMGNFTMGLSREAFDRFSSYTSAAISATNTLTDRTIKSFERVIDDIAEQQKNSLTAEKNQIDAMEKIYTKALDKLDKIGYVTNDIAEILGLPVGTPSQKAQQAIIDRLDKYNLEAIRSKDQIKEIELRANIEKEKIKEAANIKNKSAAVVNKLYNMDADTAIKYVADNADILVESGYDTEYIYEQLWNKKKQEQSIDQKNIDNEIAQKRFEEQESNNERRFQMQEKNQDRRFAIQEANANAREIKENAKQNEVKKTTYFETVDKSIENKLKEWEDKEYNGQQFNERAKKVGTAEHREIVEEILGSPINKTEKILLLNKYGIPLPKAKE